MLGAYGGHVGGMRARGSSLTVTAGQRERASDRHTCYLAFPVRPCTALYRYSLQILASWLALTLTFLWMIDIDIDTIPSHLQIISYRINSNQFHANDRHITYPHFEIERIIYHVYLSITDTALTPPQPQPHASPHSPKLPNPLTTPPPPFDAFRKRHVVKNERLLETSESRLENASPPSPGKLPITLFPVSRSSFAW